MKMAGMLKSIIDVSVADATVQADKARILHGDGPEAISNVVRPAARLELRRTATMPLGGDQHNDSNGRCGCRRGFLASGVVVPLLAEQ